MSRKIKYCQLTITVVLISFFLYPGKVAAGPPIAGDPSPDASIATFDGQTRTLSFYRGQGIILNFWATWCVPCKEEMPTLNEIYAMYKEKGVVVLSVNYHQKKKSVARFIKKIPIKFPILMDFDGKLGDLYGLNALPTTYFIDKKGIVVGSFSGPLTIESLKEWATKLAAEEQ